MPCRLHKPQRRPRQGPPPPNGVCGAAGHRLDGDCGRWPRSPEWGTPKQREDAPHAPAARAHPPRAGPVSPGMLRPQHVGAPRAVVSLDRPIRGRGAPSTERARRCFGDAVTGREGPPPRGAPQPPHARALRCVACGTTGPQGAAGLAPHPLLTRRAAAGQQKTRPERGAPLRAGDLDLDLLAQRVPPPGKGVWAHPHPRPTLVRADAPVKCRSRTDEAGTRRQTTKDADEAALAT